MATIMKALRDFRGKPGETKRSDRHIEAGVEFTVTSQKRALELESRGLAVPTGASSSTGAAVGNQTDAGAAAAAGKGGEPPLSQRGGQTGAANAPLLSHPGHRQRKPRSSKPPGALDL